MAQAEAEVLEQPTYDVIRRVGEVEIRHYGPRPTAETEMGARVGVDWPSPFTALAHFIFATNRAGRWRWSRRRSG